MVSTARPILLRWTLLAGLAFALIGMHSLVALGAHESPTMADPAAEMSAGSLTQSVDMAMPLAGPACCEDHDLAGSHSHRSPGHGHDVLHLCLAVLVALAGLIITWLLSRRGPVAVQHGRWNTVATRTGRGPPRSLPVSAFLSSLCVLRL